MIAPMRFPDPLQVRVSEPMRRHSTFGVGGPADYWVEVRSLRTLRLALTAAERLGVPRTLLGHGTNVLVADEGIEGLVIYNRCGGYEVDRRAAVVRIESGHTMARLARRAADDGLAGLTFAIGVPGTLGGAVFGNAGAFGSDIAAVLVDARVWYRDGIRDVPSAAFAFAYRHSALQHDSAQPVVLTASLQVSAGDPAALVAELLRYARRRRDTQPRGSNAGSFFKNPTGDYAGRLIDAAGLKGARRGAAFVSPVHANFISNAGGARAQQIVELARHVQRTVQAKFGVQLVPEVRFIGRWGTELEELAA